MDYKKLQSLVDDRAGIVVKAMVALVIILPLVTDTFLVDILALAFVLAIFAISVDLIWGYGGILTFGHAAFFGLGAYVMGKLLLTFEIAGIGYISLILAILVAAGVGFLISSVLFYRNISGAYFTIITLAIAIVAQQTAVSWDSVTGGYNGLVGIPSMNIGIPYIMMIPISGIAFYYTAFVALIATYFVSRKLINSKFGYVARSIKQNEDKSRALGYSIPKYKTILFTISCGIAGFAGSLYISYANFVSPDSLGFFLSTEVLIWVLIGGRGTLIGPIIGTIGITLAESILSGFFAFTWGLFVGIGLILVVIFFPKGVVDILPFKFK